MKTKYLVTGAAGNLGSSIVRELITQGADVRALVLPNDATADYLPGQIEKYYGDVLNKEDLERFFQVEQGDEVVVIHCAGIVTICWDFDQKVYDVNVEGTRNVVSQCIRSDVKKLVYISSVHAIPELPKGQTITEINSFNPDNITGFYGKTKAMASQIVIEAVNHFGLDASLIFPSGICGPFDYAKGIVTRLLVDCCHGKLPVGVQGGYDFVDVRDVAKGVVNCCSVGKKGEGYILSNQYISVAEILKQVHIQTRIKEVKRMIPIWVASLSLPYFEILYKLKNLTPVFTKYSLYTLTSNSAFSYDKAKRMLGYSVRPFVRTISDTLFWLRQRKEINF
ncbi:MAG: NAD-dependent epimerase/dehydratase family protein [Caldisericia bacterium]|nr:NAD-dependent epimerase/dehydratase family protein [Caldisericia bacterium]